MTSNTVEGFKLLGFFAGMGVMTYIVMKTADWCDDIKDRIQMNRYHKKLAKKFK